MTHVLSVVGARPQFVKLAPVSAALASAGVDHSVVHTGQHYDANLSGSFFTDLGMHAPVANLNVGSGSHGAQTGRMLEALEDEFQRREPDCVLVYGDTNSTLAGAIAAAKLDLRLAHLEAGLRSFNRRMPEEINRVLTDHAADLCLAPTELAMQHLRAEGLAHSAVLVGDVMVDVCYQVRDQVQLRPPELPFDPDTSPYVLCTLHRPSNVDVQDRLALILDALAKVQARVIIAAHPRLLGAAKRYGIRLDDAANVQAVEPLTYPQMMSAIMRAAGLVTDSGGLQKEAFLLETPCTTVRAETEWEETLIGGWNMLDFECLALPDIATRQAPAPSPSFPYGRGRAAEAVVLALKAAGLV